MRDDLAQQHVHFSRSGGAAPAYWEQNVQRYDCEDVQLFLSRAWQRFPGAQPIGDCVRFDDGLFDREYDRRAEGHWMARYGGELVTAEPERRLRDALQTCAREGVERVAIIGAGSHTQGAARALMQPPIEVVCIVDDDPSLAGTTLWRYPVVSRAEFDASTVDAVVLSSRSCEAHLASLSQVWAERGVRIVALYGTEVPRAMASMQ